MVDVLNGGDDSFDHFFSGPINFDTIEGILRARSYLKRDKLGLSPLKVLRAAALRHQAGSQQMVDNFWQSKHEVYTLVIRSRLGVLYDSLFQVIARQNAHILDETDFFATETDIFKKLPLLREVLKKDRLAQIARAVLPTEVPFQLRYFYVDSSSSFTTERDDARYCQTKTPTSLTLGDILRA